MLQVLTPDGIRPAGAPTFRQLATAVQKAADAMSAGQVASLNPEAVIAQATAQVAVQYSTTPEEVQQALVDQGMAYTKPFAPGTPLPPFFGYDAAPRTWDFVTGRNIQARPRNDRIPFEVLKGLIEAYDVAQNCIQRRVDDLRSLDYEIIPLPDVDEDIDGELQKVREFFDKPDKLHTFRSWFAKYARDVFAYDAGCLYKHRTNGGQLYALEVVAGTTIAPMIDYRGLPPVAPAPAYVQFVNGVPAVWQTYDSMIYQPLNPTQGVYGLAPIEKVLLAANTDIRFQWHFLQFFTDGSLPGAFATTPPDVTSPQQVQEFQDLWDARMLGDQARKQQVRFMPPGTKVDVFKGGNFDIDFAQYLERRTLSAFGITPNDYGVTDDVNRATGETQVDVQFRVATLPAVHYFEDIFDDIIQNELGCRARFRFDVGQEKEDRLQEAQAMQIYINSGVVSVDEVRSDVLGKDVDLDNPMPRFIVTRTGPVTMQEIIAQSGTIDPLTMAPDDATVESARQQQEAKDAAALAATQQLAGAAGGPEQSNITPLAPSVAPPAPPQQQEPQAEPAQKALRQWRDNSRRRVRKGLEPKAPTDFDDVPLVIADAIWSRLKVAKTRAEVDAAFAEGEVVKADPKAPTSTGT